jgi:hypothetical protein
MSEISSLIEVASLTKRVRDLHAEELALRAECQEEESWNEAAMHGHKADAYRRVLALLTEEHRAE